jgi:enoyl-CoA hydratase
VTKAQSELIVVGGGGAVPVVTLNRESVRNALNSELLVELQTAVTSLAGQPQTRAIVLTGAGTKSFSAGADLNELRGLSAEQAHDLLWRGHQTMLAVERCAVPVICAVNGLALGGGFELVLASAFPVLAVGTTLGLPEARLGLIPGYGGTQRLTAALGSAVAQYMMLTGTRIDAERAYVLGITPVAPVPPETVVDAAREIGFAIAQTGPQAVRRIRTAVEAARQDGGMTGLALEAALAGIATSSEEAAEGVAAFLGQRRPAFAQPSDGLREEGR